MSLTGQEICAPDGLTHAEQLEYWRALAHELYSASKAALVYMRAHEYADQAWADDLESAIKTAEGRS